MQEAEQPQLQLHKQPMLYANLLFLVNEGGTHSNKRLIGSVTWSH